MFLKESTVILVATCSLHLYYINKILTFNK